MGSGFYRQFTGFCHIEGKRDSFDYVPHEIHENHEILNQNFKNEII